VCSVAKQQKNPALWTHEMADGCSGVLDWLPFVGNMHDCCDEHDRAFYYGGREKEFKEANKNFYNCIRKKKKCWFCYQIAKIVAWERRWGVRKWGRKYFNWKGPGLPKIEG